MIATRPSRVRTQDWPPLPEREHRPLHRAVLDALGPLSGRALLDVGCGVGSFLRAAERTGALVAGTDPAVARLEVARWALPEADLRVTDPGDALPFDNGTFDVVTARMAGETVLTELARVVRPGGLVAVGSWARPEGWWADRFAGHLRRLTPFSAGAGDQEPADALRAEGLAVRGGGEVRFTAAFPTTSAAWTAMLGCEDMLDTIREVGETPVRRAFAESVAANVAPDGTVCLPKAYRFALATTRPSTSWAPVPAPDNESGSLSDRNIGRD
jgi:SAM-dependent methyltransferase